MALEVSTQDIGVKTGVLLRDDMKLHGILGHPSGASDLNVFNDFFGLSLEGEKRKR